MEANTSNLSGHEVIQTYTSELVTAICNCVNAVSTDCLAKGLITEDTNDIMLLQARTGRDMARILLQAVRCAVEIQSDCFEKFLAVLNNTLPFRIKNTVITHLKNKIKTSSSNNVHCRRSSRQRKNKIKTSSSNNVHRRRSSRQRTDKPKRKTATCDCHVQYDRVLLHFTGPLVTKHFQKLDRAFYKAIHACQTKTVMSATKKILSMNVSMDYKSVCLLYRSNCKAVCRGQLDEALLDCDKVIEVARSLECENGSLIIGRALRMKTSILRSIGRLDEALECVGKAKEQYYLAAPSGDTAALLYEEVRLKICIAMSESKDLMVYISEVENDCDRILKHSICLDALDRSKLCIFLNSQAELFLRSGYIEEKLPPTAIAPTNSDLCIAEKILNSVPLDELPAKAYIYKGWHFRTRGDLCMWRKQYSEAIEWARKAQDQFAKGKAKYITNPKERIELYSRLQLQVTHTNRNRQKRRLAFNRCRQQFRQFRQTCSIDYIHLRSCRYCKKCFRRHFIRLCHHS